MYRPQWGWVLPICYIGMCDQKGGFSVVLVVSRVSIMASLVRNRVGFLHSGLEISMFVRRSFFLIIVDKILVLNRLRVLGSGLHPTHILKG